MTLTRIYSLPRNVVHISRSSIGLADGNAITTCFLMLFVLLTKEEVWKIERRVIITTVEQADGDLQRKRVCLLLQMFLVWFIEASNESRICLLLKSL